jgi:hypothetical protein
MKPLGVQDFVGLFIRPFLVATFSRWYSVLLRHGRTEFQTQGTRARVLAGTSVRDQICRRASGLAQVF